MHKKSFVGSASALALTLALSLTATHAFAQEAAAEIDQTAPALEDETEVEALVVTGSFIARTESLALPVDVLTTDDLEKRGSPTLIETVKALTVSNGVLGESNQFGSGSGQYGRATVNLRGLGSARTLVLFNGKRVAGDDLNTLPTAAVGRIEVLKEGASSTYGSDAIGGVVNFITRRNFNGVEAAADYRFIKGSAGGDYGASVIAGKAGDTANIFGSVSYQHRSDVATTDRGWAVNTFAENPEGGWTGATNPSRYIPVGGASGYTFLGASRNDVGCLPLGGVITADGICRQQFIPWDNIVDEEDRFQLYGEMNADITPTLRAHVDVLYGRTDVAGVNTTPSFATSRGPSINAMPAGFPTTLTSAAPDSPDISNFFYVPASNPGMAAYCAANGTAACPTGTTGALFTVGTFRPFLAGGNPAFGGFAPGIENTRELTRVSGGLEGEAGELGFLGAMSWRADLTYSQYDNQRDEYDTVGNRLQLALRGLGGPNCAYNVAANAGNAAAGCYYFNPFSNAIEGNPILGLPNPGYNAAVANTNLELIRWFHARADQARQSTRLFEGNLVFNGESKLELAGGPVAYAFGGQWRREGLIAKGAGTSGLQQYPCTDSLTPLISTSATCTPRNGPYVFLGQINEQDISRNIYALFTEVSLPVTDDISVDVAGRFEDYGDLGGSTFNPKVSGRWQATENVAFRASYSTTFRAPTQTSLIPNTGFALRNVLGSFRGIATTGNPNLKPETADSYSAGVMFNSGGLRASLDYYKFKLEDVLGTEVLETVVNSVFPNGAGGANNCATVDAAYLASHFVFSGPCSAANLTQVNLMAINQGVIDTDGFDLLVDYDLPFEYREAQFRVGGSLSYINSYEVNGVSAAGKANAFGTGIAVPLPRTKSELYAEASRGEQNLRLTMRYISDYLDDRTAPFTLAAATTQVTPAPVGNPADLIERGKIVDDQVQFDLAYRMALPKDVTVSVQVQNIFDEDPPFARTELSYDPMTGNPLGRTFQINLRKRF